MDATIIRLVISTLNEVEVKGKDNMDKLLGSINALEDFAHVLEKMPSPVQETKEVDNG